jgi:hypothetical protein
MLTTGVTLLRSSTVHCRQEAGREAGRRVCDTAHLHAVQDRGKGLLQSLALLGGCSPAHSPGHTPTLNNSPLPCSSPPLSHRPPYKLTHMTHKIQHSMTHAAMPPTSPAPPPAAQHTAPQPRPVHGQGCADSPCSSTHSAAVEAARARVRRRIKRIHCLPSASGLQVACPGAMWCHHCCPAAMCDCNAHPAPACPPSHPLYSPSRPINLPTRHTAHWQGAHLAAWAAAVGLAHQMHTAAWG